MPQPTQPPAANGAATPEPQQPARQTPAQQLAAAYDLPDESTSADPEPYPEAGQTPRAETPPANGAARPVPPKDPVNGRFLSPADPRANDQRPSHPAWLINNALDLGMSDEEIAETPTAVLAQSVGLMTRTLSRDSRPQRKAEVVQDALEQGRDPFAPPVKPAKQADLIDFGQDADGNPIGEEQYDPAFRSVFKVVREQDAKIKQLEALVQQLASREVGREQNTLMDKIDQAIGAFNDPRMGTGSGRDLDTQSPEYARRRSVWMEAIRLAGDKATNEKALAQMQRAYENLFGAPPPRGGRRQVAPADEPRPARRGDPRYEDFEPDSAIDPRYGDQWERGGTMPPTNRTGSRPERRRGPQAAREAVARKMRELGQADDGYDDVGADDFLQ